MEISNEMRAAAYFAYINVDFIEIATGNTITYTNEKVYGILRYMAIGDIISKPLLYNLKDITDEHAVEVAKLNDCQGTDEYLAYIGRGIVLFHFCWTTPYDDSKHDTATSRKLITEIPHVAMLIITDTLRSFGYMLPYMGIDLFETGIAVEIKNEGVDAETSESLIKFLEKNPDSDSDDFRNHILSQDPEY